MEKIKTRSMTGTLSLSTPAGDIPGTVEVQNAAPNKMRTVIKADLSAFGAGQLLIDQRFDGTSGYMINSLQGDQPITGNQLESMKANSFPHRFSNYKAKGVKATLAGKEKVGDRDAFVADVRADDGIADQAVHRRGKLSAGALDSEDQTRRRPARSSRPRTPLTSVTWTASRCRSASA